MASNLAGRDLEAAGRASDTSGRASEWARRILKPAWGSPAPFEVLAAPWSPPSSLSFSSRLSYSSFKILLCHVPPSSLKGHLSWLLGLWGPLWNPPTSLVTVSPMGPLPNYTKLTFDTTRMKLVRQRDPLAIQCYVDCFIWKLSGWS